MLTAEQLAALAEALGVVLGAEVSNDPAAIASALDQLKTLIAAPAAEGAAGMPDEAMLNPMKSALGLAADAKAEDVEAQIEALKSAVVAVGQQANGFAKLGAVVGDIRSSKRFANRAEDEGVKSPNFGAPMVPKWSKKGVADAVLYMLAKDTRSLKSMGYTVGVNGGWLANRETAAQFIEMFYAKQVCAALGATIVPMDGIETLTYRKMKTGATAYWGGEGQAATDSEGTLGLVNLNLRELIGRTRIANRLLKNGVSNIESMITNDIDMALRLKADYSFLFGTGSKTSGNQGAEPLGLYNRSGITSTTLATNGKIPTPKDYVDAWGRIEDDDVPLSGSWGVAMSPRSKRTIENTTDTTGQLIPPERFTQGYRAEATTQISNGVTTGSSTDTSTLFFGAWEYMIIGMGQDVEFTVDQSRYVNERETLIQAVMMVDMGVSHDEAFETVKGVRA